MQVTEQFDIIIIGAGASGLCAARELTRVKMKILLLEARGRIGGRMYTNIPQGFTSPIERGAEFIHGEASLTFEILKEAHVEYVEIEGNTFQAHDDAIEKIDFFDRDWELILDKLEQLKEDMTFKDFLTRYFEDDQYNELREKITRFVEGYNAADITKVSSLALREEWSEEENPSQYRIKGGYAKLYNFLEREIRNNGGVINLSQEVLGITWRMGHVSVQTTSSVFTAKKCLITVPVPVLGSGSIKFQPAISHVISAAGQIGFGGVVKITFEFKSSFWETETPRKFKDLQFLFSEQKVPTWWSQFPDHRPLLTGWIGGPAAHNLDESNEVLFNDALVSLSNALHYPVAKIREQLVSWHVDRWTTDKFSMGAYSFAMLGTTKAINTLRSPIESTLFFAGEALYTGPHRSTVEAALVSGRDIAQLIGKI
jgi:monoamine oxidase